MEDSSPKKDKDQSLYEFYRSLQKEYVVSKLRAKIYAKKKDKNYHEKVAGWKKEKIQDISNRNSLPSIFNSDDLRNEVNAEVFNRFGLPNFVYRNEAEENELRAKDIYNYYKEGVEVKVNTDSGMKIATITSGVDSKWDYVDESGFKQLVILNDETVEVKFRGSSESKQVLTSNVARII